MYSIIIESHMKYNLIRGTLSFILGILTVILVLLYIYYYYDNEILSSQNKQKYKIFGPTPILFMLLGINIVIVIYCILVIVQSGQTAVNSGKIEEQLRFKCPDYTKASKKITSTIKSKLYKSKLFKKKH